MIIQHKKNTAFELALPMVDSATPASFKTGLTVADTAYYKDGAGAWTALAITDTFTEIGATGMYQISLTAAELNHDWVVIKCTSAGAADSLVSFRMMATDVDSLVRSTTPANTLDVTATGAAGIDWGNVENPATAVDLAGTDIKLCDTVTTNGDMRGTDSAALASVATEGRLAQLDVGNLPTYVNAILVDTDDMQPKLGTPAADISADIAAVKSETAAILVDTGTTLDSKINDIQGATFAAGTDSLEAIRDRGDAAWTTGAGGSDRLLMVDTTIATLASQTSFTLTAGSADDGAYNNCTIVIEDVATATQKAVGLVSGYVGATKTVTLKYDPAIFTMAATDKVYILAENALKSTAANRQLDVTAAGNAGIDWGNVENPATAVDLAGTDIKLCDTVATNSDMRGTDSAALASVATEARLAELDAANLRTDVANVQSDTDDIQAKLGTPAADVSADIAAVKSETAAILVDTGSTLDSKLNDMQGAGFVTGTDSLEAIRDRGDAAWTTGGGGSGETQLRSGTAQAGAASSITLDAGASATNDHYKHAICALTGGTGAGQAQIINSYVGSSKVATMAASWATAPDATTTFVLLPLGTIPGASAPSAAAVADAVWDEARADHESAGSTGETLEQMQADAVNKKIANKATGETTVYKADGTTKLFARTVQQGATLNEVEVVPS